MEHGSIERLLRMIQMLSSNVDYPTPELTERLETCERTTYRYICTLKMGGFGLVKKNRNTYKLVKMPVEGINLNELVVLSQEEAYILHDLLLSITGNSQIHINLAQKLAALLDATSVTEIIGKKTVAENVKILAKAIREKECVELVDYESGHSMVTSNRIVEPYGFSTNYADVYAYEPASGMCKIFKITRIGWVRPLGTEWQHEDKHEKIETDCFRMTGKEDIPVTLKMTLKAKNLLIEEYPLAQKDIYLENGSWILKTTVKDLAGVGRFYLGLCDQMEIVESPELVTFVSNHIKEHLARFI